MNIFNRKVIANFISAKFSAIFKLNEKKSESSACALMRRTVRGITIEQSGRSMIEMLGVLAIIGVLSVVGLVGYSKAMDRYKVNETINQITHVVQGIRDLFRTQKDYSELSAGGPEYYGVFYFKVLDAKAKFFPKSAGSNNYNNVFGGEIRIKSSFRFTANDNKAFIVTYHKVPQDACIELVTKDWGIIYGLVAISIHGNYTSLPHGCYANLDCSERNFITEYQDGLGSFTAKDTPLTPEQAVTVCTSIENNSISWKFY